MDLTGGVSALVESKVYLFAQETCQIWVYTCLNWVIPTPAISSDSTCASKGILHEPVVTPFKDQVTAVAIVVRFNVGVQKRLPFRERFQPYKLIEVIGQLAQTAVHLLKGLIELIFMYKGTKATKIV